MKRLLKSILIILLSHSVVGQNLVPNPGFENFTGCPTAQSQIGNAVPWDNPAGSITSADYFNACNGGVGTACGNVNVPNNFCGNIPANTGDGYVGVIGYYTSCSNCREYVEASLTSPLVAGTTYDIGFWVRPAELNRYFIDFIGMNIQIGPHNQPVNQPIILTPTLESGLIDDVNQWTLVSGTYTATGGEDIVCLGVFKDNADLNILDVGPSTSSCLLVSAGGHYLIDDVFVIEPNNSLVVTATSPICLSDSTVLVATPGSCAATTWFELGNPVPIGSCDTLIQYPLTTTTYVGVDTSGVTDTVTVEVLNPPVVDLGPDVTICQGQSTILDAGINPATYTWSTGALTQTVSVDVEDTYWVEVMVGACIGSDTVDVFIETTGLVDLGPDTTVCNGESIVLDAGSAGDSYSWSTSFTGQTINVSNPGQYWVQVALGSCSVSDTINVRVSNPIADFNISDTAFCVPVLVQFSNESWTNLVSDPINYWYWNFGDGNEEVAQNPSNVYDQSGDYQVSLLVRTVGGCEDDTIHTSLIHAYPIPVAGFYFTPQEPDPITPVVHFEDNSLNGHTLFWQFGDGVTSTEINPSHLYEGAGEYTIIQWATSLHGCLDSTSYTISIENPFFIYVPNAFSPNGDGRNDGFKAEGEGILEFTFEIYNRWGEMIWQTENFENSWDGTYKGLPVEGGVYVYQIELVSVNFDPVNIYGKVVLFR
jgi:gliding motility-associated-like protein